MKIKKVYQGNLADNLVVNEVSTSQTNAYSCDYTNKNNVIMVYLGSTETISATAAWGQYKIPFDKVKYNLGDKFSLNTSTNVVTYTGKKRLKVTVHIVRDATSTVSKIYPSSGADTGAYQEWADSTVVRATYVTIIDASSFLVNISGLARNNETGNMVLSGNSTAPYTYMLVEEI